ncbi:MAG: hypothetical protein LBL45_12375, partial [Treponema sp.]|nr:hypothetical protein [Treponema sp.]
MMKKQSAYTFGRRRKPPPFCKRRSSFIKDYKTLAYKRVMGYNGVMTLHGATTDRRAEAIMANRKEAAVRSFTAILP